MINALDRGFSYVLGGMGESADLDPAMWFLGDRVERRVGYWRYQLCFLRPCVFIAWPNVSRVWGWVLDN